MLGGVSADSSIVTRTLSRIALGGMMIVSVPSVDVTKVCHSHFHVDVPRVRDLVVFLKGIMPLKPVADLLQ